MKTAVIYYSKSGVTKKLAEVIHAKFNSDMYFVEPEKNYGGYLSAVAKAGGEKLTKKLPNVTISKTDYTDYDVVFIGFPVWYGTMPSFMQEYIRKCSFSAKRVIPFATAGANGKESSLETVKELFPNASVSNYCFSSLMKKADVNEWLSSLQFINTP